MKRFPGKRIVITGAGSGLGRALAIEFAKMHWRVGIADINEERALETADLVAGAGGDALVMRCDVTKPGDFMKAVKTIHKRWGGADILVNNAGVAAAGYFEKIPQDRWDWILGLNLKSIIYGCRAFIPLFKEQRSGYIVNVASCAGIACLPEMSSYNVTKAAAIALSESLRMELAPGNIGVSVACPTFFKTNLMDQFTSPDERQREMAKRLFENSKISSENIARHIIASIRKNRFYIITQGDGRMVWRVKRYAPELYLRISSHLYKKGYFEKFLGVHPSA